MSLVSHAGNPFGVFAAASTDSIGNDPSGRQEGNEKELGRNLPANLEQASVVMARPVARDTGREIWKRTHSTGAIVPGLPQTSGAANFEGHASEDMRSHCGGEKARAINRRRDGKPDVLMLAPFLSQRELAQHNQSHTADNPYIARINALPVGPAAATSAMLSIRECRKPPYFSWAMQSYRGLCNRCECARPPPPAIS